MKLSILDQSPIAAEKTAQEALEASIELAKLADKAGYTRYWVAEHHDMKSLASPAPDILLGIIGSQTERIRLGAGAVLLPHYRPYQVAERYNLLATLYPDRVDIGLGRAPGASAEASIALSGNFLENVRKMPELIDELKNFLIDKFPEEHMYSKIAPTPVPDVAPQLWLLGTSEKSGILAAQKKLPYVFGEFMSEADGVEIIQKYRLDMKQHAKQSLTKAMIAVSVFCAETTEEAEDLALANHIWSLVNDQREKATRITSMQALQQYPLTDEEKKKITEKRRKTIVGNPQEVKSQLEQLQFLYQTDEFMIITVTHNESARRKSYELIAKEIF